MSRLRRIVIGGTCAALLSSTAIVVAEAPPTIWHGLGIPQSLIHLKDTKLNKKGNHPCLERKDALKRLADPANLKSDVPAIKTAAEIKKQEDLAPQKIKAIKYLAEIGCGCYGGVGEALGAALEDCTEEVRYEAAQALYQAINCKCDVCNGTCCTKELAAKMYERAYGTDEKGCDIEGSERVRNMLARVLASCPPDMRDVTLPPEDKDILDPDPDRRPIPMPTPDRPSGDARVRGLRPVPSSANKAAPKTQASSTRRGWQAAQAGAQETFGIARLPAIGEPREEHLPQQTFEQDIPLVSKTIQGAVVQNKNERGYVRIEFEGHQPAVGTQISVFHHYVLGMEHMGHLTIVGYEGKVAIAGPKAWDQTKVVYGDLVECTVRVPAPAPAPAPEKVAAPAKVAPAQVRVAAKPAKSMTPTFEPPPVVVVDVVDVVKVAPATASITDAEPTANDAEAASHTEIAPVIIADPTATLRN